MNDDNAAVRVIEDLRAAARAGRAGDRMPSVRDLWTEKPNWHLIGGADVAAELDAKRAIQQGTEVAAGL